MKSQEISDKDFRAWLGKISGMTRRDCRQLQDSRMAEQFLIAWLRSLTMLAWTNKKTCLF